MMDEETYMAASVKCLIRNVDNVNIFLIFHTQSSEAFVDLYCPIRFRIVLLLCCSACAIPLRAIDNSAIYEDIKTSSLHPDLALHPQRLLFSIYGLPLPFRRHRSVSHVFPCVPAYLNRYSVLPSHWTPSQPLCAPYPLMLNYLTHWQRCTEPGPVSAPLPQLIHRPSKLHWSSYITGRCWNSILTS